MTQDRIANWGESEAAARYQTGDDDPTGGDFIVARDLDGQRMLLKFDFTADEWQYAGDVDMGGGDLNSVGTARIDTLEAGSVSTEEASIGGQKSDLHFERVDTHDFDNDSEFDFDGLEPTKEYELRFQGAWVDNIHLRFENDDGENYEYIDESGTLNENQTEIQLLAGSATTRGGFVIEFATDRLRTDRVGLFNRPRPSLDVSGFAQTGSYDDDGLTSVRVISTGGNFNNSSVATLFERDSK